MRLRPHHIYCFHILGLTDPERGQDYLIARQQIEEAFRQEKGEVEVTEGPDMLCTPCAYFDGDACTHPNGDETQVRKWDAKILRGLDIEDGQTIKIDKVKHLIKKNAPLDFCANRCPYSRADKCDPKKLPDYLK